jgi:hypothetical protein
MSPRLARTRARLGEILTGLVGLAFVVAVAYSQFRPPSAAARSCGRLYRQARTLEDTLAVDRTSLRVGKGWWNCEIFRERPRPERAGGAGKVLAGP